MEREGQKTGTERVFGGGGVSRTHLNGFQLTPTFSDIHAPWRTKIERSIARIDLRQIFILRLSI